MLTHSHIDYLRGIVRKEISWRADMLEKFQPRPNQTAEEAEEIKGKIERNLRFANKVLAELDHLSWRATTLASSRTME